MQPVQTDPVQCVSNSIAASARHKATLHLMHDKEPNHFSMQVIPSRYRQPMRQMVM